MTFRRRSPFRGEPPASALLDICPSSTLLRLRSVEEILAALEKDGSDFRARDARTPEDPIAISLKLTLSLLRAGRASATLNECLEREYAATLAMLSNPDFYEGVRAAVIDKDRNPKWSVGLSEATPRCSPASGGMTARRSSPGRRKARAVRDSFS